MKTIIVNQEIEAAVARMSDTEAAALFRALLLSATSNKQKRISRIRSEAGRKGAMAKWQNDGKKENEEEKEKDQKNKEEEKEPEKNNKNLILFKGENEWQTRFKQLCQDMDYLEQFRQKEDLTRDLMRQYLKVFAQNLQDRYPNHHWQSHEDFRRHFQNWYRLPLNSRHNIVQQYAALTSREAARRRKSLMDQQLEADRQREQQEWAEHKKRAVPCPEALLNI